LQPIIAISELDPTTACHLTHGGLFVLLSRHTGGESHLGSVWGVLATHPAVTVRVEVGARQPRVHGGRRLHVVVRSFACVCSCVCVCVRLRVCVRVCVCV
jgi:hypothetical protein